MRLIHKQRSGGLALWLVLAALLLRAMIPDGFMLERHEVTGSIALAFCYASPLAKLRADHGVPSTQHAHEQCAFAAATGPALLAAKIEPVYVHGDNTGLAEPSARLRLSDYRNGRPPVRGPPVFS